MAGVSLGLIGCALLVFFCAYLSSVLEGDLLPRVAFAGGGPQRWASLVIGPSFSGSSFGCRVLAECVVTDPSPAPSPTSSSA